MPPRSRSTAAARPSSPACSGAGEFSYSARFQVHQRSARPPNTSARWRTSGADVFVMRLDLGDGNREPPRSNAMRRHLPRGMALDSANNVVLTGTLQVQCTSVFGTTPPSPAELRGFVAKFNPAGQPTWGRILDGDSAQRDDGHGVAVDGSGNVVATGTFTGAVKFGDATRGHAGDRTAWAYLVKLNGSTRRD